MKNRFRRNIRNGLFFLISIILLLGCNKDITDELDIKSERWKLESISDNGTVKTENKDYFRENAYVLILYTDSTFQLNTSVNVAGGNYNIPKLGDITISYYGEYTKVGTSDEKEIALTEKLLNVMPNVERYKVLGNTLYFYTLSGEIKFKKD